MALCCKTWRTSILSLLLFLACGALDLGAETSVVTIESARSTSYYTDEATEDEIIVFTGDVVISVVQGKSTSRIRADRVNFNRSRNLLYAYGNVFLSRDTGNGTPEEMTAEGLLFNIDTEEGIFDAGRVVQSNSGAMELDTDSKMVVSSELFARDDSGTVAFKSGSLTFCDEPDPHWKINASRIWLLPGNEFAFANALLYIGKVPIAYFPFFYYPKDELVFNPVFGYDQRRGYFVQTTTYFMGRKKPSENKDEDSFFSFLSSSTMYKQRREGLVLRNLEEKDTENYPHTLKFMADYYSNLGGMVGIDGIFSPNNGYISKLDFSLNLGFSRTLFPVAQGGINVYVPYDAAGAGHYNNSYFAGMSLPFRYRGHFNMSLSKPFSLTMEFPLYSDPFFNQDFLAKRQESMDWFNFLMSSGAVTEDEESETGEVSSFLWRVSASVSPKLSALSPYVSSLSFSPKAELSFFSLTDTSGMASDEARFSPSRKTFYPGLVKPFYITASISGTLFEYPMPEKAPAAGQQEKRPVAKTDLHVPDDFMGREEADVLAWTDGAEGQEEAGDGEADAVEGLSLPAVAVSSPSVQPVGGLDYKLTYSVSPYFSSEIGYNPPIARDAFDWNDINSTFVYFTAPITLSSRLGYRDSFVSLSNGLTFTPVYQRHPIYKNESNRQTIKRNDYVAQKLDLSNANSLTLSPFVYNSIFSGTNVSWNTNLRVIRTNFVGTADDPRWEYKLPEWDQNSFSTHGVTVNLKSQQGQFFQQFSYTTVLPPLLESHSGTLSLGFPFVSASLGVGMQRKSINDVGWMYQPIHQSLNLSVLAGKLTFTESYRYNLAENHNELFSLQLSGYGFTASYNMQYVAGYDYDQAVGWKVKGSREFQASHFDVKYSSGTGKKLYFWKNRIALSLGLDTSVKLDFLRPTNSHFTFTPSVSLTINEFLTVTFGASSQNDVIYRYIQKFTDFNPKIPGEENVFTDLWHSFSFWDEEKRRMSGFKLKSLNVGLTHELHDWTLSSQFTISPRIVSENGRRFYDFSPHFTLSVVWKPMNSMKTTIEDKYGTITLNP